MERVLQIALNVIGAVGAALFLGYLGFRAIRKSADPARAIFRAVLSIIVLAFGVYTLLRMPPAGWPLVAVVFGLIFAIIWGRTLIATLAAPLLGIFTGGEEPPELKPFYSIAEGKRKKGLYTDAILEVQKQLEKFPNDFTGTMIVATVQAEDLKDLPMAKKTIDDLLAVPGLPPQRIAGALQTLADWQLRFSHDPEAARETFERIALFLPETQWAQMAHERIARLPTAEGMAQMRDRTAIKLPQGHRNIGLSEGVKTAPSEISPDEAAAECVKRLEQFPLDHETREKLAMLYAEHFNRVDMAADQLEQLIAQPFQPPKKVVYWLNLLATIYIRHGNDLDSAEKALRRIVDGFPGLAPAEMAITRLSTLRSELQVNTTHEVKALGAYKRDLGLR